MKYFTFCKMSPAHAIWHNKYRLLNPKAPEGFIFCDTEKPLTVDDLRTPLFKLSQLFDNPKDALVFKIKDNVFVASYSVVAIPPPILVSVKQLRQLGHSSEEGLQLYPTTDQLPGWYIGDIKDRSVAALPFDIGSMYDNCTQLQRLMGSCPCPHKDSGVCVAENVLPAFGGAITVDRLESDYYASFSDRVKSTLKRNFSEVGGFSYVSPAYTTDQDFYHGLRPWDDIDFSNVEARTTTFKIRGEQRKQKNVHIKTKCDACVFARKRAVYEKGRRTEKFIITSCIPIKRCHGNVDRAEAIAVLQDNNDHHGIAARSAFTGEEIHDLLQITGQTFTARSPLSLHRVAAFEACGFMLNRKYPKDEFVYSISPTKGNKRRATYFPDYYSLIQAVPEIVERIKQLKQLPSYKVPYPKEALWACALLARMPRQSTGWGNHAELRKIAINMSVTGFEVTAQYSNGRRTWSGGYLDLNNFPEAWLSPYVTSDNGQVKILAQRVTTKVTSRATQSTD